VLVAAPNDLIAGRYRLVRLIGRGGMGVVWEARDERLERPVALKQLRTEARLSGPDAELAKQRAMREARITARLHHPNAVSVFDVVEHEGQPCLVMQLVPSIPLTQVLRELKVLEPNEAARVGAQVAAALAAAHTAGIVHRDVKPGNILIGDDGVARISDFGISRALGDSTLTTTGMVSGTPAYLAPEVARGSESNFASDVFSLGATLYTMVEGAPPFGTDQNFIALLHRVAVGEFPTPHRAGPLTYLVERMLSRDPQDRPAMSDVAQTLAGLATAAPRGNSSFAEAATTLIAPVADRTGDANPPADRGTAPMPTNAQPGPVEPAQPTPPPAAAPVIGTAVAGAAGAGAAGAGAAGAAAAEGEAASSAGPGEGPPTFRSAPPTTASPPPAPPSTAGSPQPEGDRRRRRGLAALVAAVLLAGVVLAATLLPSFNQTTTTSDPAAPTGTTAASEPASPAEASPSSPSRSASTPEASPSPTPSATGSASRSPSPSPTTRRSRTPSPVDDTPTAAQLAAAISTYYALVPDDLDDGWQLMTASYQTGTAQSRGYYERFWGEVDEVSVSNVEGSPPDRAEATVTYVYEDDRVVVERTRYQLVEDDGVLKINRSEVLSSTAG